MLFLAIPALAASSCAIIDYDGFTDCTFGCPGTVCAGNGDCHAGCGCRSHVCTPLPHCSASSDCGSGETCINQRCEGPCAANGECQQGDFCLASVCRANPPPPHNSTTTTHGGRAPGG